MNGMTVNEWSKGYEQVDLCATLTPPNPAVGQTVTLALTLDGEPVNVAPAFKPACFSGPGETCLSADEYVNGTIAFEWTSEIDALESGEIWAQGLGGYAAPWDDPSGRVLDAFDIAELKTGEVCQSVQVQSGFVDENDDLVWMTLPTDAAGTYWVDYDDGEGKASVVAWFELAVLPEGSPVPLAGFAGLGILLGAGAVGGALRARKR